MRKQTALALTLFAVGPGLGLVACGDDDKPGRPGGKAGAPAAAGSAGMAGTSGGSGGSGGASGTGGAGDAGETGEAGAAAGATGGSAGAMGGTSGATSSGGSTSTGGMAGSAGSSSGTAGTAGTGTAGTAGGGGTGGMAPECPVDSLIVFPRSDTDESWDDNDFSQEVMLTQNVCPVLVDVTWPHEQGWENADPSEANFEQVHFTLDSYESVADLTGKQLNVTIELQDEMRGPRATDGGYIVSLLSVSTFQRVIPGGAGGMGGMSGTAGTSGAAGGTSTSGAGGVAASDGTAGTTAASEMPMTETGYSEAEVPEGQRRVLYYPGDRVTVRFPLPAKTAEEDSYDPTTAIKVNLRIYNLFEAPDEETPMGEGGADTMGTSGMGGENGDAAAGAAGDVGTGGSGGTGNGQPVQVYDYLTSRFAITNFTVTDAGAR